MDLVDSLVARLRKMDRTARIAFAAECADRAYPIYERWWSGTFCESVRRSIDMAWEHACGAAVDAAELRQCGTEVEDLVTFYSDEEDIPLLRITVTLVLFTLQALDADDDASCLAVARAALAARETADQAAQQNDSAAADEKGWQERALAVTDDWQGPARREMFEALGALEDGTAAVTGQ
jgi:hypothetical protein